MRSWIMAVAVGAVLAGTAFAAETGALDGKTYVGQVCPKGKKTGDADTLTFANGQFDSAACHKYGFGAGAYTAKTEGDTTTFTSQTHGKNGTIDWQGTVKGDKAQGTMTFHSMPHWYTLFMSKTDVKDFEAELKK